MQIPKKASIDTLIRSIDSQLANEKQSGQYKDQSVEHIDSSAKLDTYFKNSKEFATGVVLQVTYMVTVAVVTLTTVTIKGRSTEKNKDFSTVPCNASLDIQALLRQRELLISAK